jgi:hypothetical protein
VEPPDRSAAVLFHGELYHDRVSIDQRGKKGNKGKSGGCDSSLGILTLIVILSENRRSP